MCLKIGAVIYIIGNNFTKKYMLKKLILNGSMMYKSNIYTKREIADSQHNIRV